MGIIPGTIPESSPETFTHADRSPDGTDAGHYMDPDDDSSLEQPKTTPTNPRSTNYDLRRNSKPNCHDDCRLYIFAVSL